MALPVTVMGWLQRDRVGVRGSIHGGKGDSPKRVAPGAPSDHTAVLSKVCRQ